MEESLLHSEDTVAPESGWKCRDMLFRIAGSIGAALLIIDEDFDIVWVNEVVRNWFGHVERFPRGKCYKVIHGRSDICQGCAVKEVLETGRVVVSEKPHVFPDGTRRELLFTAAPITDDAGAILQVLELVQDITDRKRAENEVAQRLLYEKMVQEISSGLIASSDLDEEINIALEKLVTALRTDFAQVLRLEPKKKRVTLTHEWNVSDALRVQGALLPLTLKEPWPEVLTAKSAIKCSDTSQASRPAYQLLKAVGVTSILAVRFTVDPDTRGFLCVGHHRESRDWVEEDIWIVETVARLMRLGFDRRRKEEEFVESQERYKEILNTLKEGVGVVDADERISFCNPEFERIFEVPMQDLLGKSILNFLDQEGRDRVLDETRIRKKGASSSYELPIHTVNGNRKHLLVNVSPFSDASGRYAGAVGVVLDITERKKAEEELRESAEKLEQSNELKDLFADILRHDLLDSIGVVKAYAETLLDNEAAPREKFLSIILENTDKVVGIIQDASQLAKLEASLELEMQTIDLYGMAKEVVDSFHDSAAEKGISLLLTGEPDISVNASPVLREVLRNLVSNAFKYGAEGGRVVVSVSGAVDGIRVSVADRGKGIPDEHKECIFDRFKRASRDAVQGTGLGLAIAKRIVALHGGTMWVEDNPEGGAIFIVCLPVSSTSDTRIAA